MKKKPEKGDNKKQNKQVQRQSGQQHQQEKGKQNQQRQGQQGQQPQPTPVEQGHTEAIKEDVKKTDESKIKLDKLLKGSGKVLIRVRAFFPFDLFPDEIVVSLNKVDIIVRQFFQIENSYYSIPIEDIGSVFVSSAIFFATIQITDKSAKEPAPIKIKFLKIKEAVKISRIIRGLMVAKKQGVDLVTLADFKTNAISQKLEELGKLEEFQ